LSPVIKIVKEYNIKGSFLEEGSCQSEFFLQCLLFCANIKTKRERFRMPVYSYSKLSTFDACPLQYRFRYIDGIQRKTDNIEAFLGSQVHEALHKLYRDLMFTKSNSLSDLIDSYEEQWSQKWHPLVRIVKKEYTVEHYKELGRRCIKNYYQRHLPFDDAVTIGLEKGIRFPLDETGEYQLVGYIDRLAHTAEGVYEIHDYKTSSKLPDQQEVDSDQQLGLYQLALTELLPDARQFSLVWHYLAFDRELRSTRSPSQLARLKEQTLERIRKIEASADFPPAESPLCYWCHYPDLCPLMKHLACLTALPSDKYSSEEGYQLVNNYAKLKAEKRRIEAELEKLKEAVIAYAKREGVEIIRGKNNKLQVKVDQRVKFPGKGEAQEREALEGLLKEEGKWMEVSDLSNSALIRAVESGTWSPELVEKVKKYQRIEEDFRIRLMKSDEEKQLRFFELE